MFSPGVDRTATFEADLLSRGIPSYLADYSVDGPPPHLACCTFDKKYLGAHNDETYFTLANWVKLRRPDPDGDLILQMDIEGWEYAVLLETPLQVLTRFRIILVEFHNFEQVFSQAMSPLIRECFHKLLEHFTVVHVHPNNYQGLFRCGDTWVPGMPEVTLLRKDRIKTMRPSRNFPHPLDQPNLPNQADVCLPESMICSSP